jgi:alkylation response protein AidB-like acyl-CoA dehydrogenase
LPRRLFGAGTDRGWRGNSLARVDLPPEADELRGEIRRWLELNAPAGQWPRDFVHRLAAEGYVAPHWPRPWGRDAGPLEQLAIDAELRAAHAPRPFNPIGIGWAGPTLLVAGTPDQQQRWIPGILDGSEIWCQLFSEPGAGSDLASLSTRAALDGDEWVVHGQKVWTTFAHLARWGILLARTDPETGRQMQTGVSYFVVDMRDPGITIRPIRQMDGKADFNEVLLDGVRIPTGNLVGTVHDGWRLAKVTLGNERVSLSGEGALWGQGPTAHDLLDLVRAQPGGCADPHLRQRLAALFIEAEVLRLIRLRTLSARVRGLEPGPEASVRKALADEHGQHVMAAALDLAGTDALLCDRGPFGAETTMWADGYLYSRALTIGGGTSEVQRNIVGERVLGLPRDAGADA